MSTTLNAEQLVEMPVQMPETQTKQTTLPGGTVVGVTQSASVVMPWKKLTARQLAIQQGTQILEGADWVDDEVRFRDEREFLSKWQKQDVFGQVPPGPGLQIRPGFDNGAPCIRFACGRKMVQIEKYEGEGRVRRVPSIHVVVGAIVSFGNGTHVRVEGLLDLGRSEVNESQITGNEEMERLGVWRKSIIERQRRLFVRCYVQLCRRDWATQQPLEIVQPQLNGTILELKTDVTSEDRAWIDVVCQYTVQAEFKESYTEVAEAVGRKVRRAIDGRKKFLARINQAIRDVVESSRNRNEGVKFLTGIYHPLPVKDLVDHLASVTAYTGKNGTRYYDAVARNLFFLRRDYKSKVPLTPEEWAPTQERVAPVVPPSAAEAAFAANAEAKDAT